MKVEDMETRKHLLTDVIKATRNTPYFSTGQRICLHQERAALFQALDHAEQYCGEEANPRYRIPPHLERILKRVVNDFKL